MYLSPSRSCSLRQRPATVVVEAVALLRNRIGLAGTDQVFVRFGKARNPQRPERIFPLLRTQPTTVPALQRVPVTVKPHVLPFRPKRSGGVVEAAVTVIINNDLVHHKSAAWAGWHPKQRAVNPHCCPGRQSATALGSTVDEGSVEVRHSGHYKTRQSLWHRTIPPSSSAHEVVRFDPSVPVWISRAPFESGSVRRSVHRSRHRDRCTSLAQRDVRRRWHRHSPSPHPSRLCRDRNRKPSTIMSQL